jgi:hypothetical protein
MHTNAKILGHLTKDSERLTHLAEEYLPVAAELESIYFYETYETKIIGGKSILVGVVLYSDIGRLY